MKIITNITLNSVIILCLVTGVKMTQADEFTGFSMEFVEIKNAGNTADDTGYGAVGYNYRMGTHEVSRGMIEAYNANSVGPILTLQDMTSYGGNGTNRPAAGISWNEAARFVNWLNTSTGHVAAYKFTTEGYNDNIVLWTEEDEGYDVSNPFRNSKAHYFLPSEDEWYKAAYYDGSTGTYYDYATGSDTVPTAVSSGTTAGSAVYNGQAGPADITNAGGLSPYGTIAQNGNVWEWSESAYSSPNDSADEGRVFRGGVWGYGSGWLRSSDRPFNFSPNSEGSVDIGFRVASSISAPTINNFTPGGGPVGLNITIHGSDFNDTSSVQFNGVEAQFTIVSDTQIDTTVPNSATSGTLSLITPGGTAVSASTFTITDSATVVSVCDEASLNAALSNNSGEIIFDCDGIIEITSTKDILSHLTLDANGHDITISGGDAVRIFTVNTAVHLTLRNLTIANGRSETLGGGIYNYDGVIDAIDCTFRNNVAFGMNGGSAKGGAIYNLSGSLNLTRCTLADNKASGGVGNVGADNGGQGGTGGYGYGGGIYSNDGTSTVTNCTFHGNQAIGGRGGTGGRGRDGYYYWVDLPWPQDGYMSFVPGGPGGRGGNGGNGLGGSFYNLSGAVTMINTTLARGSALGGSGGSPGAPGNYASGDYGPGSLGVDSNGGNICATSGVVTLKNTLIAYGEGNPGYNCSGTMTDNGNNICSDISAAFTLPNSMNETDPLLTSALASNGGPTMTLAILKQSPAINAGDDALAPENDQRHFARDGQSDIGAYEIPIYTYTSDNGEITLTGYNGPCGSVNIPPLINGMPVVQIGDSAFRDIDCVTGVTIPDTVTSIGHSAFYHCSGLIGNLSIPSSVTSMGDMSFGFCGGLTGVYFRGDAPTPNASVFSYANNITVYYLPDATGWGSTYGARPTVLWNPKIKNDANFGVQANVFGFNISAPNDFSVIVEASPDLSEGSWVPVESKTLLEGSCYFSDPQWTNYPCRFYRLRMP